MSENKLLGVALVKEICPACTKEMDGPIILNTKLDKDEAENVEKMHGQVIGFSETFCKHCQDYADKGIILIGIDESKSDDMRNPYRSGHFFVVKESWLDNINDEKIVKQAKEKRMMYVSHKILKQ